MNDYNNQEIQMKEILTYTMNTIYKEPQNTLNHITPPLSSILFPQRAPPLGIPLYGIKVIEMKNTP